MGCKKRRAAAESMVYDVEVYAHHAMVKPAQMRKKFLSIWQISCMMMQNMSSNSKSNAKWRQVISNEKNTQKTNDKEDEEEDADEEEEIEEQNQEQNELVLRPTKANKRKITI